MIALEYPYLSPYLADTIIRNRYPVIRTDTARKLLLAAGCDEKECTFISADEACRDLAAGNDLLYTISESALDLIAHPLFPEELHNQVQKLKNKLLFREGLKDRYPDFFYQEADSSQMNDIDPQRLPYPVILKPAVGFFSIGVKRISNPREWREFTDNPVQECSGSWDTHVIDSSTLIIEEVIEGEEYAVDAYFDENGAVTLFGIYQHLFSGDADVSDRIYLTSAAIMRDNLAPFIAYLSELGERFNLRKFPIHGELRVSKKHGLIPIEINPLRFGGWCTTPDISCFSYGFNQYELLFSGQIPDWDLIIETMGLDTYSLIVLDNASEIPAEKIQGFDREKLLARLTAPLEFRPIDFRTHNVFGFIFARNPNGERAELLSLLHSDLREFIIPKEEISDETL